MSNIENILKSRRSPSSRSKGAPIRQEKLPPQQSKLLIYVWDRMYERCNANIAQIFRIFDTKGRGKLKKSELLNGLETLNIQLTTED